MVQINQSEAFKSMNNLKENFNYSFNVSDYPALTNMTNSSALETPATAAQSLFTPINSYWASPSLWGPWFYVALIVFTVGTIYAKSQNIFRTSIAMLFMSLIAAVPGATGAIYIPSTALYTLYIFTGIALTGALYSMWVGD